MEVIAERSQSMSVDDPFVDHLSVARPQSCFNESSTVLHYSAIVIQVIQVTGERRRKGRGRRPDSCSERFVSIEDRSVLSKIKIDF
jgi:hypothetical protein